MTKNTTSTEQVAEPPEPSVVAIDLFSGGGGMTLGAQQAGIKVLYAVERCRFAAATYSLNFPRTQIYVGDIRNVNALPKKPKRAKTIVFGGPPCQGFSTSNQRTRCAKNPDNWMYQELIRVSKIWNPDWIVIENVKGIRETLKGFFLSEIVNALKLVGYVTTITSLNAVNFGVPQRRERTFMLASKSGKIVTNIEKNDTNIVTAGEAISDLPKLAAGASIDELPYEKEAKSGFAQTLRRDLNKVTGNLVTRNSARVLARYPHVPQGGNWENIPPELMKNYGDTSKCHTGIYRRLTDSEPSVVIGNFRKNMLIHPYQNRGLSVREAARIQSIPDSFRFCGSIGFQQQQVGNMVPPPLARSVFLEVMQA